MKYGHLFSALMKKIKKPTQEQFTIGRVVDTNDPQQMGRVRVWCPGYGDTQQTLIKNLPWAAQISPLAGVTNFGYRGVEQQPVKGPVAYGMWNTPKIGSYVLVGCIDGDQSLRFYAGGLHPQYMTHTLPHGRFLWNDQQNGKPDGPVDTYENPIEPLYSKLKQHFTKQGSKHAPQTPSDSKQNMEWRTRGADMQVSAITNVQTQHKEDGPGNDIADHTYGQLINILQEDGSSIDVQPGYATSHLNPNLQFDITNGTNYDSHVYSWTTPGFHSFSMDDRADNSRIRLRTVTGHQLIMDDTNERIYVSTAGGETWIELDNVGNIDIHASKNISYHAGGDINFTTEKTFRVHAEQGIHLYSGQQTRIHSLQDINVRSEQNIRTHSVLTTRLESDSDCHINTSSTLYISSNSDCHINTSSSMFVEATSQLHIKSTNQLFITTSNKLDINASLPITITGQTIDLNGPVAQLADSSTPALSAQEVQAFWTSRVPQHEPWARVFMDLTADQDQANMHTPEYPYTSNKVGKGSDARGEQYIRNSKWKR